MADSVDYTEELEKLAKEIPEGINMEEFVANVSKLAAEFVKNQRGKPIEIQVVLLLVFLLIPISLILFCFCKIMNSQKKRQGKEKKKQKDQKSQTKKRA
ncbi:hypothetical protein TNCT_179451 [Trichonephila clavata]|uniref:Uncharacterized protein n=1 Tax=Trichonephila clavata TaxID=2740835 RepID=A0A8X6LSX4_TRICU|nr:hypothetical protein TNCT_179451 [Trichonephila clavata]